MLCLLILTVLCVSSSQGQDYFNGFGTEDCTPVPAGTVQYNATITLSRPVINITISGGNVTFSSADGLYFEVTGSRISSDHFVCVGVGGEYKGLPDPEANITITPLPKSQPEKPVEIGSLKVRRAQKVWSLNSVPVTTNTKNLLSGFEPYKHQWGDDSLSGSTKHSSDGALVVHYAKGSYSQTQNMRGVGWFTTPNGLSSSADDLLLSYDIYFEDFGFGKMGKLPGLYGGVNGEGAYQCSGGNNPSSCFSLRLMWREGGAGELYAYIPSNQESGFKNRPDVIANPDYGQSIGRGKIHFQNGVWQTVTEQVHLNTVGKTDGWVKFCNTISGQSQQCYTAQNLNMRNSGDHHLRGLFFSTFFGGSSAEDAAPNDCRTYYRNFSIAVPDVVVG